MDNIASSGTSTFFITISPVIEVRKLNFPSIFGVDKPLVPFSRIKPFILLLCASDLAQITKTSAMGEFEIHIFEPEIRYPPETFFAKVFIELGSDPASDSVNPKQPIRLPFAISGK